VLAFYTIVVSVLWLKFLAGLAATVRWQIKWLVGENGGQPV
jgi:hypothetical protein